MSRKSLKIKAPAGWIYDKLIINRLKIMYFQYFSKMFVDD